MTINERAHESVNIEIRKPSITKGVEVAEDSVAQMLLVAHDLVGHAVSPVNGVGIAGVRLDSGMKAVDNGFVGMHLGPSTI